MVQALIYGATPALLIGWVPLAVIIASLWSLVVTIIGIRELHSPLPGQLLLSSSLLFSSPESADSLLPLSSLAIIIRSFSHSHANK